MTALTSTEQLFIERPWYKCFLHNDHLPYFQQLLKIFFTMLSALELLIFLLSSFIEGFLFVSAQQKKWNKKEKYPEGVQIFTFSLKNRFVSCQTFPKEIWQIIVWSENVFKGNLMLQFSWLEEFRWGKVSGWWAHDKLQYENGWNDQL